jgi:PilZ domain
MISAELMLNPPHRGRRSSRQPVNAPGSIASEQVHRSLCRIDNISATGARLKLFDEIDPRAEIELRLPNGVVRRCQIVWVDDLECGCAFHEPLGQDIVDALADGFGPEGEADPLFKRGHA